VRDDDARLRQMLALPVAERAACFDRLRKEYPVRREFAQLMLPSGHMDARLQQVLAGLGFSVGR
jgi:erythronate-4-phosphate dehydrogenase